MADHSDAELETMIVHILMDARSDLSQRYGSAEAVEEHVFSADERLLSRDLFGVRG